VSDYIFRFPRGCPALDFASLSAWTGMRRWREIGTTVTVTYTAETAIEPVRPAEFRIRLYGTEIAVVRPREVLFPGPDDPHMATTAWVGQIVRDNAIGGGVGRIRRRKADGEGPRMGRGRAGLLVIGGRDRPVFGHAYPVGDIAGMRRRQAEAEARWAVQRAEYAEETRRREALRTFAHPVLGSLYAITRDTREHGYHWEVVDGTFCDQQGYVRDCRVGRDDPWYSASPEPGPKAFTAFAGGPEHRTEALGAFDEMAGALSAIGDYAVTTKGATAR
jgi:hypothetical protein